MEAGLRIMLPKAKKGQDHQKMEEARNGVSLELVERAWPYRHLGFRLLASRLRE